MYATPEKELDEIVEVASAICDTPISILTFINKKEQWLKACKGVDITATEREDSFCQHALNTLSEVNNILQETVLVAISSSSKKNIDRILKDWSLMIYLIVTKSDTLLQEKSYYRSLYCESTQKFAYQPDYNSYNNK
ncbi:MAG: hypothetical protein ACLFQO_15745 [Cyclobacteriaceae bacterium]